MVLKCKPSSNIGLRKCRDKYPGSILSAVLINLSYLSSEIPEDFSAILAFP